MKTVKDIVNSERVPFPLYRFLLGLPGQSADNNNGIF